MPWKLSASIALGALLAGVLGYGAGYLELGFAAGGALACGLGVLFALTPTRRGFRLLGVPLVLFAIVAAISPGTFVSPGAVGLDRFHATAADGLEIVSGAGRDAERDAALALSRRLRAELGPLVGAGDDCAVRVYLKERPFRTAGEFGEYDHSLLEGHVVVHPLGAGWGSLAHHLTYAFAACGGLQMPDWVTVGLASGVEKFRFDPKTNELDLRHRHDWRKPPPIHVITPAQAQDLLKLRDPNALRSLFVFLRETGRLETFMAALRERPNSPDHAMKQLFPSASALLTAWRAFDVEWQKTPALPSATVVGAPSI